MTTIADLFVRWIAAAPDPNKNPRGTWSRAHVRMTPTSHLTVCGRWIPQATHMEENGPEVPGWAQRCERCFKAVAPRPRCMCEVDRHDFNCAVHNDSDHPKRGPNGDEP